MEGTTTKGKPPVRLLYAVTAVGVVANTMITPNIPDILDEFGRSEGDAGVLVGAGALPGVVVAPIIGVLADRLGRKRVLLPCLVLFAVGALLAATAGDFRSLIGARLVQGLGAAGLINLTIVMIGDYWTGLERTSLIGRNSAVLTAALAVLPSLSGGIAEISSWRFSVAVGLVALPMAGVGLVMLPDHRPDSVTALGPQLRAAGNEIRRPALLVTFGSGFLLFVVIFGVFLTALPIHLRDQFGLGPGARGLLLSIPALGAVVASYNLGRIRAVVALRVVLVGSSVGVAAAALGAALAPSLLLVVAAMVLYGFAEGGLIPALQDIASSAPPPEHRASVMAVWVSSVRLGQTVGPIGTAALIATYSTSVAMVVGAAIFVAVACLFAASPVDDSVTGPR